MTCPVVAAPPSCCRCLAYFFFFFFDGIRHGPIVHPLPKRVQKAAKRTCLILILHSRFPLLPPPRLGGRQRPGENFQALFTATMSFIGDQPFPRATKKIF